MPFIHPQGFFGGTSPFDLSFHAFDDVAGSFVADVIVGTGTVTEGCVSDRYHPDDNGAWQVNSPPDPGQHYAGLIDGPGVGEGGEAGRADRTPRRTLYRVGVSLPVARRIATRVRLLREGGV